MVQNVMKKIKIGLYAMAALLLLIALRGCGSSPAPQSPPVLTPVQQPPLTPIKPWEGSGRVGRPSIMEPVIVPGMKEPVQIPVAPGDQSAIDSRLIGKWCNPWGSWHYMKFDPDGTYTEGNWTGNTSGKFRHLEIGVMEMEFPGIFEPNVGKMPYRIDGDTLTLNGIISFRRTK
jgi:hypothetical protein